MLQFTEPYHELINAKSINHLEQRLPTRRKKSMKVLQEEHEKDAQCYKIISAQKGTTAKKKVRVIILPTINVTAQLRYV